MNKLSNLIILASTSSYKIDALKKLGIPFKSVAPPFNENDFKSGSNSSAKELSLALAQQKALSVSPLFPDALVIGSDQVCALNEQIFDKPGTLNSAKKQLITLQGATHHLYTAVATVKNNQVLATHVDTALMSVRQLNPQEIEEYLQLDNPINCCGAYKIENNGLRLFNYISTEDFSSIIGIPLLWINRYLNRTN